MYLNVTLFAWSFFGISKELEKAKCQLIRIYKTSAWREYLKGYQINMTEKRVWLAYW